MDITGRAILRTARLVLRPVEPQDATPVIVGVGQLQVSRFLAVVPHPYGAEDFANYLAIAHPGKHWAITDLLGFAGIISLDPTFGFWVTPDRQGRGYVTEAARAVLAMHFSDADAGPVGSSFFLDNVASARVHQKLGFTETYVEDSFCRALGQSRPHARQRLTRADWYAHGGSVESDVAPASQPGPSSA